MDDAGAAKVSREETLTRMVAEYQGMLLRLCYISLRDVELARDATQETFLKAYRRMDSFSGRCSEKTWLSRIATNTCRSMQRSAWYRHTERRITPEELPLAAEMACTEDEMDVMCSIMMLPEKLKEVVLLHYWQDISVSEMARTLGIAHASVSGRLKRARERLRGLLDGRDFHE